MAASRKKSFFGGGGGGRELGADSTPSSFEIGLSGLYELKRNRAHKIHFPIHPVHPYFIDLSTKCYPFYHYIRDCNLDRSICKPRKIDKYTRYLDLISAKKLPW